MTEIILPNVVYPVEAALEVAGWAGLKLPESIPDYRERIRLAIDRAPQRTIGPDGGYVEDRLDDLDFANMVFSKPDRTIIGPDLIKPRIHSINTSNPAKYYSLIEQVLEITAPHMGQSLRSAWAQNFFEHEMAHAAGFHLAGHDWSQIRLSVDVFRVLRRGVMVADCVFGVSSQLPITKLQYAMTLVNPAEPSEIDIEIIGIMGYPSVAEVIRRYEATYE